MKLRSIKTQSLLGSTAILFATLPCSTLWAQNHAKDTTMNRTVVVEQQYNPDIMDAQKVNVLPEIKEFTSTPNEVEYDRNAAPATVLPGSAMAAYAGEEKQNRAKQGYLRLGYGSKGNLDVEGNYLFNLSPKDKLNLSVGMQGMNGEVDYIGGKDWDSHFYRTRAGLDYTHQFNTVEMDIAGNYGLSNFNYMPRAASIQGRQKFSSGDVRLAFASTDKSLPMQFRIGTGLYLYSREYNFYIEDDKSQSETEVRTHGDFTGEITDDQHIGVAFEMNNIFYNDVKFAGGEPYEDYTTLLLKPYYKWEEEDVWKLHAGVNVDLAFGYGKKLRVSPDVKAEYIISDRYVLYANATGGRILNDFRHLEQVNPYGILRVDQNKDSYEQVNASLGFKMSPATGLWFNLYGGYQSIKDDIIADNISYYAGITGSHANPYFSHIDTDNFFVGLQANYSYKDVFNFMAKGQYSKWDADDELALRFKPKFAFDFQVGVHPIPALGLNLGYEYVKRDEIGGTRIDNINNLSLSATYDLFKGVSMYARFSNLFNKKYEYYALSPMPGFNFVGGLIFSF